MSKEKISDYVEIWKKIRKIEDNNPVVRKESSINYTMLQGVRGSWIILPYLLLTMLGSNIIALCETYGHMDKTINQSWFFKH